MLILSDKTFRISKILILMSGRFSKKIMWVEQFEKQLFKYNVNNYMLCYQLCLVPLIMFGFIYLLGYINIYDIPIYQNATIPIPTNDLWKIGIGINVSTVLIFLYFVIYMFLDFLTAFIFLVEGVGICFVANVTRYYIMNDDYSLYTILVIFCSCLFLCGIMSCCCYRELDIVDYSSCCKYFPSILVMLPFFTIFNFLRFCCGYRTNNSHVIKKECTYGEL